MTNKVIHHESISKMLHILGILTDHRATIQLDTIKSQVTGDYLILKNTKKNKNYEEISSKCANFYISYTHSQYSDIDLLDLTKLVNLFQIKDPRKYTSSQVIWKLSVFEA